MNCPFIHSRKLVFEPQRGSPWAEEMVLNPALIEDPTTGRIHMLFRATGPWPEKQLPGKPLPYPIFLGYAYSDDRGETWQADFSRPALSPRLEYEVDAVRVQDVYGERVVNYANGCIEDPRLFFLEGECYLTVACRMMPPGPYWIHDEPTQCAPDWIATPANPYGKAASQNVTVNVLYKVELDRLVQGRYDDAFHYVAHLTDPSYGEDRDVVLFPERLVIDGRPQYVCLHRPVVPKNYPFIASDLPPSMFICAADDLRKFSGPLETRSLLASPRFVWERERIATSTPPLRISPTQWLLPYHGKQDAEVGYTQSFMILEQPGQRLPQIVHRCPDRLLFAVEPWEMPHKFQTPCIFMTGMIKIGDELLISYGAADERVGIARIDYEPLLAYVRQFDTGGNKR